MTRPKAPFLLFLTLMVFCTACGSRSTPVVPTLPPAVEASPTPVATATDTLLPTDTATPTLAATPTTGAGATQTSPVDGMTLVYVPEGSFTMGFSGGYGDEQPQHTVTLEAFWVDRTEVTNGQYALCVQAGACQRPRRSTSNAIDNYYGNDQYANYPVIYVSWDDASAYCQWAGRRLPTEAEWEKAARGTDGRLYSWGNDPPDSTRANFENTLMDVTQVGKYPLGASPYGALDMAGNIWEWTADWYSDEYYSQSPEFNPSGPDSGEWRVLRGGSWLYTAVAMRASYRYAKAPDFSNYEIGIRCASSIIP